MTYELVKELKEAGFVQKPIKSGLMAGVILDEPYKPTLSELIEACGEELSAMLLVDDEWIVGRQGMPFSYLSEEHLQARGKTLEEAVARLWLALNKK